MTPAERMASRGDRIQPPDNLGKKLVAGAGAVTVALQRWFQQTGNDPASCTFTPTVVPTAKTLTITIVVAAP